MIQLAVEDEIPVLPLDMSGGEAGLGCAYGLGEVLTEPRGDKTLRKLAKADRQAGKAAKKAGGIQTPPIFVPEVPPPVYPPIDVIPIPQPVYTLPGKPIYDALPLPTIQPGLMPIPDHPAPPIDWIPGPTEPTLGPKPVLPLPRSGTDQAPPIGGRYSPGAEGKRRDWRQVLDAPRRGKTAGGDTPIPGGETGTAVESPPFQAPPVVSPGMPAGGTGLPAGSAEPPMAPEQAGAATEPGVLNIGGMQIRTSTLMWGGLIVGGFILLNNMTSKKR